MNRSLANVIFGAVGLDQGSNENGEAKQINVKSYSTEEAAMIFDAQKKYSSSWIRFSCCSSSTCCERGCRFFIKKGKKFYMPYILLQEGCQDT